MRHDLLIRNATVVTSDWCERLDIGVADGRIVSLTAPGVISSTGAVELDSTGLIALPGGIDTHTHICWPYDDKRTVDDFGTATRSAVISGTTTVVDFVPPDTDCRLLARCERRVEEIRAQLPACDVALHPIITSADAATLEDIPKVISAGFTSFKMYTTYEDRRIDDGAAWTLMTEIARHGGLPGFHAENHELIGAAERHLSARSRTEPADFPQSRPELAEAEAIHMLGLFARKLGTPVWIFHVSSAEALAAIRDACAAGAQVFAETCTHYLTLDDSVFDGPDPWRYVIAPPIRSAQDRDTLWAAVLDGTITAVGSDHCAYATADKGARPGDYRSIPAGAPGIEARGPLLWDGARRRGLDFTVIARVGAESAAKALGLYPRKGVIRVGSDADVVLWDPEAMWTAEDLPKVSDQTFSLYSGLAGRGRPRHVVVGGELAVKDGTYVGRPSGRFLTRFPVRA
jgi:dihydropyrimidinase